MLECIRVQRLLPQAVVRLRAPSPQAEEAQACRWFGERSITGSPEIDQWPVAPVLLSIKRDVNFEKESQPKPFESVESRQGETVNGRRLVRIESTLNDNTFNSGSEPVPDGIHIVRWVVELPPDGKGDRVFSGVAVPNDAATSISGPIRPVDPLKPNSTNVDDNAAVLDAMMHSLVFTAPSASATTGDDWPTDSDRYRVVAVGKPCLNLRASPDSKSAKLQCIPPETELLIECMAEGQSVTGPRGPTIRWDRVTYLLDTGYVSDALVEPSETDPPGLC